MDIKKLNEIEKVLQQENFWKDKDKVKKTVKQRKFFENILSSYKNYCLEISNIKDLFRLGTEEKNEEIIGSEFYVMKYVSGEAPSDNPPYHMDPEGMMGRASPDQIRSVWVGWLENLVSFHKINYEDLESQYLLNKTF